MQAPQTPKNEQARLKALKELSLLDTLPEEEYDDIVHLASQICNTPISLISLIDEDRQWFKAKVGLDAQETPREYAFCAHAIHHPNDLFVIQDSRKDVRFIDNPLVTDQPEVVFYAGMPLTDEKGNALGTICVIDHEPKELTESQSAALKALSRQVMRLFELRKQRIELELVNKELELQNEALDAFARTAAHDLKSPLNNIKMLTDLLIEDFGDQMGSDGIEIVKNIEYSSATLSDLITGILEHNKNARVLSDKAETFELQKQIREIIKLIDAKNHAEWIITPSETISLTSSKAAFYQIMINLLSNAFKYNQSENPRIEIQMYQKDFGVAFTVRDNGPGIPEASRSSIFDLFTTAGTKDQSGAEGTGIGLATVKSLIEGLGGQIEVESVEGIYTSFYFNLKNQA